MQPQATRTDQVLSKVHDFTKNGWRTTDPLQTMYQPYSRRRTELSVEGDCLMWGTRVIVPGKCREKVLAELHVGHSGMTRMKALARSYVWWQGLDEDIERLVKACQSCQGAKSSPPAAPLHPWLWPTRPWARIHVDFAGPFQGKSYLVVVDAHSKWLEIYEMAQTTTGKTIEVLRHIFSAYGLPEQLVSDKGPSLRPLTSTIL